MPACDVGFLFRALPGALRLGHRTGWEAREGSESSPPAWGDPGDGGFSRPFLSEALQHLLVEGLEVGCWAGHGSGALGADLCTARSPPPMSRGDIWKASLLPFVGPLSLLPSPSPAVDALTDHQFQLTPE